MAIDTLSESHSTGSIAAAVQWIEDLLLGQMATAVAVIAVAWLGYSMLQGRVPLRDGARVVIGCFILFGAPAIARGLVDLTQGSGGEVAVSYAPLPPHLPFPASVPSQSPQYDPYAGASAPI